VRTLQIPYCCDVSLTCTRRSSALITGYEDSLVLIKSISDRYYIPPSRIFTINGQSRLRSAAQTQSHKHSQVLRNLSLYPHFSHLPRVTLATKHRPQQSCYLRSSEVLSRVDLHLVTDVSGQPIGPIFKGQAVPEESTLCNIPEERTSHLNRGRS
jgi:hypothetical protein